MPPNILKYDFLFSNIILALTAFLLCFTSSRLFVLDADASVALSFFSAFATSNVYYFYRYHFLFFTYKNQKLNFTFLQNKKATLRLLAVGLITLYFFVKCYNPISLLVLAFGFVVCAAYYYFRIQKKWKKYFLFAAWLKVFLVAFAWWILLVAYPFFYTCSSLNIFITWSIIVFSAILFFLIPFEISDIAEDVKSHTPTIATTIGKEKCLQILFAFALLEMALFYNLQHQIAMPFYTNIIFDIVLLAIYFFIKYTLNKRISYFHLLVDGVMLLFFVIYAMIIHFYSNIF